MSDNPTPMADSTTYRIYHATTAGIRQRQTSVIAYHY
jgi:hypothetical protein